MATSDIHNITFLGSSDAGKTTLIERVAHHFGAIERVGTVEDGTTLCDFLPDEKEKRHSLSAGVVHLEAPHGKLNLVDTPGYPDFVADAITSMGAAGTAVIVVPARETGVPFHALQLWEKAGALGLARSVVVTRLDGDNLHLDKVVENIREVFGQRVVPFTLANGTGSDFTAVSVVEQEEGEHREHLVDAVVEANDQLMEKYLEEGDVSHDELEAAFPLAMAKGTFAPLFCIDPVRNVGVDEFAEFMIRDFPDAAMQLAAMHSENIDHGAENERVVARVWKVLSDKHLGQISYLRILQGTLKSGDALVDPHEAKPVKMNGLSTLFGEKLEAVPSAGPGDIVAVTRIDDLCVGDVMVSEGEGHFHQFPLPTPYTAYAITPKDRTAEQKIGQELHKLEREDPCFKTHYNDVTHETIVEGLSELHLAGLMHRLEQRGVAVDHRLPRIAYKETITTPAEGHHRHKKQTGGKGQFAECYIRLVPAERGSGYEFLDKVVGGSVPRQFIPAVEKGVAEQMVKGVIAGSTVVDMKVELYDGKFHAVDSDEHSFKAAGARALIEGFEKANPILLEPIMSVAITVPSRYFGDVSGDLNSRRGQILGMESAGDFQTIQADVPLSELQTYSTHLRAMTHGEGHFSMEEARYAQVPSHLQADIVSAQGEKVAHS
ncbi:MAG: elongation factor G [Planctomycetota bacterium]